MDAEKVIKCVDCGSSEFRLMRNMPEQILADCLKCGRTHVIEGDPVLFGDAAERARELMGLPPE